MAQDFFLFSTTNNLAVAGDVEVQMYPCAKASYIYILVWLGLWQRERIDPISRGHGTRHDLSGTVLWTQWRHTTDLCLAERFMTLLILQGEGYLAWCLSLEVEEYMSAGTWGLDLRCKEVQFMIFLSLSPEHMWIMGLHGKPRTIGYLVMIVRREMHRNFCDALT